MDADGMLVAMYRGSRGLSLATECREDIETRLLCRKLVIPEGWNLHKLKAALDAYEGEDKYPSVLMIYQRHSLPMSEKYVLG